MSGKSIFFKLVFPKIDPNFPINPEAEIHARHQGTYQRLIPKIVEADLDAHIDGLIEELEHVRREAKRRFALAKNKLRA